ncbi:glycoside hydrolase family 28 protein [Bacteroides sp. 214]|uniref:glycoside hydrolase family 28 protein n=1 Tax=Bacteroides sp. 214 TaxID=2302935 RepID=UPI0013D02473|nr:glycoside hydrolase family 28 protein [Bacteroides sp. 214]NDW13007.1 glycoside hydrolase family 28 protein [Bacteroides sp. 214]
MNTLSKTLKWTFTICVAFILASCGCQKSSTDVYAIDESIYENLPFNMAKVEQPSFPAYEVNIKDFGAQPNGIFINTDAINNAIKAVNAKGGGKVVISEGLWLTGPIQLLSNVNLFLDHNALVLFSDDHKLYPIIGTSFEGLETRRCTSPIWALDAENVAITGFGTFDGAGDSWRYVKKGKMTENQWKALLNKPGGVLNEAKDIWYPNAGSLKGAKATSDFNNPENIHTDADWDEIRTFLRPVLLSFRSCKKVLFEGVTFKNSASWCIHPLSCEHITLNNVKVSNPWYSQNGDALDLESCTNALIINCLFDAGDDAICLKSGKNESGRRRGQPCQNVIVKNNTVLHGHGGFVVGSEMSGGVKNIFVSGCTFMGTDVGLRFKSTRGRGGIVENIYIENIQMINIPNEPLLFDLFYGGKAQSELTDEDRNYDYTTVPPVTEETPAFRNIHISNVTCKGSGRAIFFNGLPEMPVENISVKDVVITDAKEGVVISQAKDVKLENITIETTGPQLQMRDVDNIKINGEDYKIGKGLVKMDF